ncbi:hypothetical protein JX266_011093 [Neoarthrinium moseri]|uniref:uncharacterized protein n=1 Tax=Neoarthrinium moseri TaxID=1658444 RepID=UPI001FDB0B69|nr:uncharacterized protein JN550_009179 [Neoarthrinium moseri]KAI1842772.1 hypothetical protein JX266_011093 [Neoarthrinium moseri]KAI1863900.1 hypothetical protein JN550_009179 [Neoarthrinium moseri]
MPTGHSSDQSSGQSSNLTAKGYYATCDAKGGVPGRMDQFLTQRDTMERFWVTGQPTGKSKASKAQDLKAWDRQWASLQRKDKP